MDGVKLNFDPEETEFIINGDRCPSCKSFRPSNLQVLSPYCEVKSLGITFDSGNTFTSHITKVCYACYYHLKDLRCIRKFLIMETAALLPNSMISS